MEDEISQGAIGSDLVKNHMFGPMEDPLGRSKSIGPGLARRATNLAKK